MEVPFGLLAVLGFFMNVGVVLEKGLRPDQKEALSDVLDATFAPYDDDWYRDVNGLFQMLFDFIYGYENTPRERLVWLGILGAYLALFVARTILLVFDMSVPETTLILTTALLVSSSAFLLGYGTFGSESIVRFCESIEGRFWVSERTGVEYACRTLVVAGCAGTGTAMIAFSTTLSDLRVPLLVGLFILASAVFPVVAVGLLPENTYPIDGIPGKWHAFGGLALTILGILFYVGLVATATITMGGTASVISAMAIGTAVIVPCVYVAFAIQEWFHSINPLRAMSSSVLFVAIVGVAFPSARSEFLNEIRVSGFLVASYLAFNVFADAISLIETKRILEWSRWVSVPLIVIFLILDLLLSAAIYLVLPIFVGQDMTVFVEAVTFSGPSPWMGILFWSTFSTSAIFYLFVASIPILQLLRPITRRFRRVIRIEDYPVIAISLAIDLLIVLGYAILEMARLALAV